MTETTSMIIAFLAVAIVISVGILAVSISYDAVSLDGETTITGTPAAPVPEPTDISSLVVWLDASDGTTITTGIDADHVAQWDDKSGEGNDMVQGTGTEQPEIVTSVAEINGKTVLHFDGVDDEMGNLAFSGGDLTQPVTYFMVMYPDQDGSAGFQNYLTGTSAFGRQGVATWTGNQFYHSSSSGYFTGTTPENEYKFYEWTFDGASSNFIENGVEVATGDGGTYPQDGLRIASAYAGTSQYAQVRVAEILVFDADLTEDERNDMRDYLEVKYDIGLTLVGDYSSSQVITTTNSTWSETQDTLGTLSQSSFALIALVLIVIAAVVILAILRRN